MLQIYYDGVWNDWKRSYFLWNGIVFENGNFALHQPITEFIVAYANGGGKVSISGDCIVLNSGTTTSTLNFVSASNENFDFSNLGYKKITITGSVMVWESAATWQIGFCNAKPTTYSWVSVKTETVVTKTNSAASSVYYDFSYTGDITTISGEKYICFRGTVSGNTNRSTVLYISSIKFHND